MVHPTIFMALVIVSAAVTQDARARPAAGARTCVAYGPDTVSGRLTRHVFYGAPGFGEDPQHDEREAGFYLELERPVCTTAGDPESGDAARRGVRRVQLVLDSGGYARLRPLLGRTVGLRGTLFGAITGHHHAPLLLEVLTPVQPVWTPPRAGDLTRR